MSSAKNNISPSGKWGKGGKKPSSRKPAPKVKSTRKPKAIARPDGVTNEDICLKFTGVKFAVAFNPDVVNELEDNGVKMEHEVTRIADIFSDQIMIDKSYVNFPENKHRDTFISHDGWKTMCEILERTSFGKKANEKENALLEKMYHSIITAFMAGVLLKYGYTDNEVIIDVQEGSAYAISYFYDAIQEWKTYPGDWRTWDKELM